MGERDTVELEAPLNEEKGGKWVIKIKFKLILFLPKKEEEMEKLTKKIY